MKWNQTIELEYEIIFHFLYNYTLPTFIPNDNSFFFSNYMYYYKNVFEPWEYISLIAI